MAQQHRPAQARRTPTGQAGTSFVITLWLEPTDEAKRPEWRWRVAGGQHGEQRYFRSVADLLTYVSECTALPPPD